MGNDLALAFVIGALVLLPVGLSAAYGLTFGRQLLAKRRFVLIGSWLAYGIYGALLALTAPVVLAVEPVLSGICGTEDSQHASAICIAARWTYQFGWLVAIALWLVLSIVAIQKLARHWNSLLVTVWGRRES